MGVARGYMEARKTCCLTDVLGCALPGVCHLRLPTLTPLKGEQPEVQLRGHLVACVCKCVCVYMCVFMHVDWWNGNADVLCCYEILYTTISDHKQLIE